MSDPESTRSEQAALSPEDWRRLHAALEGTLDDTAFIDLDRDMCRSPALRRAWIELVDLDLEAERVLGTGADSIEGLTPVPLPLSNRPGRGWLALAALIALAGLVLAAFSLSSRRSSDHFETVALPDQLEVAVVTEIGDEDSSLRIGERLQPGILTVERGSVQLDFLSGARVRLDGPARLDLLSSELAFLHYGDAAARVPEEAVGFTLKTPESAVVDLGTEFAVSVEESGSSRVEVYDGEVHVSLLGEDGATLSSYPALGGEAIRVEPATGTLGPDEKLPHAPMPRVSADQPSPLKVSPSYRSLVLAAEPVFYWGFDGASRKPGVSDDLGSGGMAGQWSEGIEILFDEAADQGALRFPEVSETSRYLSPTDPIEGLNEANYTVEFWARPERFRWATLVDFVSVAHSEEENGIASLCVVELMHESHFIHRANAVRFLHRWPAARGGGLNVFSNRPFIPGQWLHIAAVKEEEAMKLYLNGTLAASQPKPHDSDEDAYRVVFGQLDHTRPLRQFVGLLDEVALHRRALDADEIRARVERMHLDNPGRILPLEPAPHGSDADTDA